MTTSPFAHRSARQMLVVGAFFTCAFGCTFNSIDKPDYALFGLTQKGPFIRGSTVIVQELDLGLSPTGVTYLTETAGRHRRVLDRQPACIAGDRNPHRRILFR
jgi:hypothetical protein